MLPHPHATTSVLWGCQSSVDAGNGTRFHESGGTERYSCYQMSIVRLLLALLCCMCWCRRRCCDALVGCSDVGWSCRKVNKETRAFLQVHYSIQPSDITLFFKNRSVRIKPYSPTLEAERQQLKQRRRRAGLIAQVCGSRSGSGTGSSSSSKGGKGRQQQQQHSGSSNGDEPTGSNKRTGSVPSWDVCCPCPGRLQPACCCHCSCCGSAC